MSVTQEADREVGTFTLLIDCLPMLTGGDNGGAKWAAIGIIDSIHQVRPEWRIIIMCRALVVDELRAALPDAEILIGLDSRGMHIADLRLPRLRDGQYVDAILCPFVGPQIVHPQIPIASVIYDVQFRHYPNFFAVDDLSARARNMVDALERSDRVVCASESTRDGLIEFYAFPAEQISTIRLRVADRLPEADSRTQLDRFGLKPQGYLLYPANAWMHKNHAMLLVAYALYCCKAGATALKLVCTGTGPSQETDILKDAIRSMGLDGKVDLLGFLDAGQLAMLFDNAYAMLFPSMFEGFGMPVLEAMQRGTPVLCSDLPPLREVAADAALYFDHRRPEDLVEALLLLQRDRDRRADLIMRGRECARPFTDRQRMGEEFASLIAAMVASRQSGRPHAGSHLYKFGHRISPAEPAELENVLGSGWSTMESHGVWCLGQHSELMLHTESATGSVSLELELWPFLAPDIASQRLALFVNGKALGEWNVKELQAIRVDVPASIWNAGRPAEITLLHPDFRSPHALGMGPDQRELSLCLHGLRVDQQPGIAGGGAG